MKHGGEKHEPLSGGYTSLDQRAESAGPFEVGAGRFVEAKGASPRVSLHDVIALTRLASTRGGDGLRFCTNTGGAASNVEGRPQGRRSRMRTAYHTAEKCVDIGLLQWRPKDRDKPYRTARITVRGEELLAMLEGGKTPDLWNLMAKTKAGLELFKQGVSVLQSVRDTFGA